MNNQEKLWRALQIYYMQAVLSLLSNVATMLYKQHFDAAGLVKDKQLVADVIEKLGDYRREFL